MKVSSNTQNLVSRRDELGIQDSRQNNIADKKISTRAKIADNGYSALPYKELNNQIGMLQSANRAIGNILGNANISLDDALMIINNSKFFGREVFRNDNILKDSKDNVIFDANRILDIIPTDREDIYIFKKSLKNEQEFIQNTLDNLKDELNGVQSGIRNARYDINAESTHDLDYQYLTHNPSLFSKAHNTDGLAFRIDSLLANDAFN